MMMRIIMMLLALAVGGFAQTLDIYVIDVEGGNATLFVTPAHDSLLIDTGNAGPVASVRDAGRILEAMKAAGVEQIDHLIITHWHGDHFGGLAELASKTTIKEFIDHGPNVQPGELADNFLKNTYPGLYAKAKHTVAKPGDKIVMSGLDVRVVASAGEIIKTPLPGAGKANPYCANYKPGDNNAEDPHVGGDSRGVWEIPHDSSGGSDEEQGIRVDVSDESHRHGGCAVGAASRAVEFEFGGGGVCAASAGRDHE